MVWAWLSRRPALALTIENRLSAFENRQSKIRYRKSTIENRKSKIGYRKSTIENRKSKIGYRKSTIENRKLKNRIYRLFRSKINERLSIIGYRYFCPLWRSIGERDTNSMDCTLIPLTHTVYTITHINRDIARLRSRKLT